MNNGYIKTERLLLRPICMDDLDAVHIYADDPDNTRYMMFLPNDSIDETKEFIRRSEKQWNDGDLSFHEFVIVLDGQVIGGIDWEIENETEAELGWTLTPAYHNKGYVTEAALALCEYIKKNLSFVTRIFARCDTRNTPSERVMRKLGMTLISESERVYPKTGETAREYLYAMEVKRD